MSNKIIHTCIFTWFIFHGKEFKSRWSGDGEKQWKKIDIWKGSHNECIKHIMQWQNSVGPDSPPMFLPSPERNFFSLNLFSAAWVYPSSSELFYWSNRLSKIIIYAWMLWSKRHLLSSSTFQFLKTKGAKERGRGATALCTQLMKC